jgi:hypothetical protein
MSQFRVEKLRAGAEVTLATGLTVRGAFFLAGSTAVHGGPERVADLLNAETGFFPFETVGRTDGASDMLLINRAHVLWVLLLGRRNEPQLDPGYTLAMERHVAMALSNGTTLTGRVRVYRPQGRDRLSDYARTPEVFRYLEAADGIYIVNTSHVVQLSELAEVVAT